MCLPNGYPAHLTLLSDYLRPLSLSHAFSALVQNLIVSFNFRPLKYIKTAFAVFILPYLTVHLRRYFFKNSSIVYFGRALTSIYILPIYSPITPKQNIIMPHTSHIDATVAVQPGIAVPKSFDISA